jgi:CBS domain-containing protein
MAGACARKGEMEAERIHRLLVLSRDGEPRGVVSLADVAVATDDNQLTQSALKGMAEPKEPPALR